MYLTILVLVIALLCAAVGFIAAWIMQGRTLQQLRRDTEEEIMIWRETCEEIEQEASGFREHAEALERRLGSAHNVGRERIVALEAEIASVKQSKADLLAAVEHDWRSADLSDKRRAMLEYAVTLTRTPAAVGPADVAMLRRVGFSDRDILDIVEVTAYYAYANRIADGLGVELESWIPDDA